jgi:hypothetical protein
MATKALIFLCLIEIVFTYQSDLCLLPEKICNSNNECKLSACGGQYKVQCTVKICALNQESCDSYFELKKFLFVQSKMRRFNKLMKNIRICSIIHAKHFHPDEFCTRKDACLMRKKLLFGIDKIEVSEPVKCTCMGKFNETCGDYCTTKPFKCAGLTFIKKENIKQCSHGGLVSHAKSIKYYSLFI